MNRIINLNGASPMPLHKAKNASNQNNIKWFICFSFFTMLAFISQAQVNAVTFGKNRVQYKTFKWQYYQTKNFNIYFNKGGQELAKFVAQSAENELPEIEKNAEFSMQRRANIVLYNNYTDMMQSNIGLNIEWQNTGGGTKIVNNKMIVYFDANHAKLRHQIRHGIAQIITQNKLLGDNVGEVVGNKTLLDLPKWLTDGYINYLAENWSTEKDDELKSEILSNNYKNFTQFAFKRPDIAGQAFWYYIEEKYKKENVTYFLYLMTSYKSLNKASMQIAKQKFSYILSDFMEYADDKYGNDINHRKPYPKGNVIESFDINPRKDYFKFNVNPNKKNNTYVVTQFKKGIVRVIYNDGDVDKTILKFGIKSYINEMNPSYPLVAWDSKGTRFAVMYSLEGQIKMFVYDVVTRIKYYKLDLTKEFDQVQDMKYMLNSTTMLLSAVKNGHTDIFTLDLVKEKTKQITNDVYDDLDPSLVAFPNKTGIIFSSNRPNAFAKTGDTVLPSNNRYNVFLITNFGDKPELNQITQLSNLKFGNARYPMQYNVNHFTFVSDQNGIGNRYAGFFTTEKAGLDTLVLIDQEILHNPSFKEVDSTLRAHKKTDVDSIAVVSISNDSAYTFPLTNYQSSLAETRTAGDLNQVSEVTRQSDEKILYKLKINEDVLRKRNMNAQPTAYMKKLMAEYQQANMTPEEAIPINDSLKKGDDSFQSEFKDSSSKANANQTISKIENAKYDVLKNIKLFKYNPPKFSVDAADAEFNTNVLMNRFDIYTGGSGPIRLGSSTPLSGLIKLGTTELMEDIHINGAFKISTNLKNAEWLINYQNLKRRLDWGLTYYRKSEDAVAYVSSGGAYPAKLFTNLYQANISYPFDKTKSIRLTTGVRSDKICVSSVDPLSSLLKDDKTVYSVSHLEYVYDNTMNPTLNIWNGLRFKGYLDVNSQISKVVYSDGPMTFNVGYDVRYYYPIYRNFIWAGRAAADASFGNQKMLYYLGGVDGWLMFNSNTKANGSPRYFNPNPAPDATQDYAFQSLAVNMRGFIQNIANGNNAMVFNSEFRLPIVSTFFNRTINNPFLQNLMITQFVDLGTAWVGDITKMSRPEVSYTNGFSTVRIKAGGVGPFAGGYGFGIRSSLAGYFVKFDAAWPMNVVFKGKPQLYLALGLDF